MNTNSGKISITLTGDILPANTIYNISRGIASDILRNGPENRIEQLSGFFRESDFSLVNLESSLSSDKDFVLENAFIGHSEFGEILKQSGVSHINMANNHVLEHSKDFYDQTISQLQDLGLEVIGNTQNGKPEIVISEKNGLRIGFASMNAIHDHFIENTYACLTDDNIAYVLDEMEKAKVNFKILSFHWGDEYIHLPSPEQIRLGRMAIDKGADIVHGHHPHVIQPVEKYKNGYILYSLGNFVFDAFWSKAVRNGLVITVSLSKNGEKEINYKNVAIAKNYFPVKKDNNYFEAIQNSYNILDALNTGVYEKSYAKKRRRIRFISRIRMKINLVLNINKMDKFVLINIFSRILWVRKKK